MFINQFIPSLLFWKDKKNSASDHENNLSKEFCFIIENLPRVLSP